MRERVLSNASPRKREKTSSYLVMDIIHFVTYSEPKFTTNGLLKKHLFDLRFVSFVSKKNEAWQKWLNSYECNYCLVYIKMSPPPLVWSNEGFQSDLSDGNETFESVYFNNTFIKELFKTQNVLYYINKY